MKLTKCLAACNAAEWVGAQQATEVEDSQGHGRDLHSYGQWNKDGFRIDMEFELILKQENSKKTV
jgi:hypothetical protein